MDVQAKTTKHMIVTGSGRSKQDSIADALSKVSKIDNNSDKLAIQMQPININVISAEQQTYKEHFLYFFLPRDRTTYNVKLDVEVEVKYMDLKKINFSEEAISDPNGLRSLLPKRNSN